MQKLPCFNLELQIAWKIESWASSIKKEKKRNELWLCVSFLGFVTVFVLQSYFIFFVFFVCRAVVTVVIAVEFGFEDMSALNLSWHSKSLNSQVALRCGAYPTCSHQTNALTFRGSESMGHSLKFPFGNSSAKTRLRNHIRPPLRVRSSLHYRVLFSCQSIRENLRWSFVYAVGRLCGLSKTGPW